MDKDDDYEARKLEAMRPLMFEAGAALWNWQGFEHGLALQLYYFARLGVAGLDAAALKRILDNDDKRTAGQMVALMKKHMLKSPLTVTVNTETAIDEGLKRAEGSQSAHPSRADRQRWPVREPRESSTPPRSLGSQSRAALVEKIRAPRRKVNAADKKLRPVIALLSQLVEGENMQEIEQKVRDTFFWGLGLLLRKIRPVLSRLLPLHGRGLGRKVEGAEEFLSMFSSAFECFY